MKELLMQALTCAMAKLDRGAPTTKTVFKYVDISNVSPFELESHLVANNIPKDAEFSTCGEYGPFDTQTPCISYSVKVAMTDKEILKERRKRFDGIAWNFVYPILLSNGYKQRPIVDSNVYKFFNSRNTTIYDLCIAGDFDLLEEYYSHRFVKQ